MAKASKYKFQTEAKELLDLMVYSVYSNKDIFLRELISNSSDALDKLRFESLSDSTLEEFAANPTIRVIPNPADRKLSVEDNGIGMSRDELRAFIGVIAKSGTKEYVELLKEAKKANLPEELIGQFGVGFYSSFMVAEEVTIVTRKAGGDDAYEWKSTGDGTYTIADATRDVPGTTVTLQLKDVDDDAGVKDYTDEWVIKEIVKKYSDFVGYPIVMKVNRSEVERDEEGKPVEGAEPKLVKTDETLNSMKAIWTKSESEVEDEEYNEFYKHLTRDWTEPLLRLVSRAEGTTEFRTLLYVPSKAPFDMYWKEAPHGVQLYIKRVFIMSDCQDLLPMYLRFVKGVVDSEDLPLNISREILQQDRNVKTIRKHVMRKLFGMLKQAMDGEGEKYLTFWKEFGKVLKEGIFGDQENQETLLGLSLFESTASDTELTSLDQYIERMKEGQEAVYYLTGKSRDAIESSPHLEALKAKEYEVLLLSDAVDEVWVQSVMEYKEKKLASVGKGEVELGTEEEKKKAQEEREEKEKDYKGLLELIKGKLEEHVKEARLSSRLTSSPACLVGEAHDMSPQLEQMMRAAGQEMPKMKRILELNPEHAVLQKMHGLFEKNNEDPRLGDYAQVLFGQAVLAEGNMPPDPAGFSRQVADLLVGALGEERREGVKA